MTLFSICSIFIIIIIIIMLTFTPFHCFFFLGQIDAVSLTIMKGFFSFSYGVSQLSPNLTGVVDNNGF